MIKMTLDQLLAELDRRGYMHVVPRWAGDKYDPVREWAERQQDTDYAKRSYMIGDESPAGELSVVCHVDLRDGRQVPDTVVRMVEEPPAWYLLVPQARQAVEAAGKAVDRVTYEGLCARFGVQPLSDDALRTRAQSRLDTGVSNELTLVLDCARDRALAPIWEQERAAESVRAHGYATRDQVNEIMWLLRRLGGNPMSMGGWMGGPTKRDEVAQMSRDDAERYIDSMRESADL